MKNEGRSGDYRNKHNTVSEIDGRMVRYKSFDATANWLEVFFLFFLNRTKYVMQVVGNPKGFMAPVCQMDFRVGGKSLCCMEGAAMGQGV